MTDRETKSDTEQGTDSDRDREHDPGTVNVVVVPENDRAEALGDLPDDELEAVFFDVAEEVARRKSGRW